VDFFGAQARARQQSRLLGWGFAACLLAVVLALDIVVLFALRVGYASSSNHELAGDSSWEGSFLDWALIHPGTVMITSLLVGGFIGTASLMRMLQLREGGGYVARSVGGVRVERSTPDPQRRMLHNVVEEMALASGVPLPEVYVLEQEDGINAFAAGHTPANAAVAVTRGALQRLNRDQLQGVIAHEFSHILNGDMRLSIRLMGLVFGLMAVALAGRLLLRLASQSEKGSMPAFALGAVIAVIGQVGLWSGRLLQAWISRQRECLADASAVQFTRNPDGLKEALLRVAAMGVNRRFASTGMEQVAHMLFAQGGRRWLATHPPLLERLQELDPHITAPQMESMIRLIQRDWARQQPGATPETTQPVVHQAPVAAAVPAAAALIAASAGEPQARHLDYAAGLRQLLPHGVDTSDQARTALLALVVGADPGLRDLQLERIAAALGSGARDAVRAALPVTGSLPPLLRLPAVLQLFPALRTLPRPQRSALIGLLNELVRVDGRLSVFEYALDKLVARGLQTQIDPRPPHGSATLADRDAQLGVVFAVLARHGTDNAAQAQRAYEAGMAQLLPRLRPAYAVIDNWPPVFDQALDKLCDLRPQAKQLLIEGLVRCMAHDELLTPAEAELLRAICAVLDCPLPPVLPENAAGIA
jgi:Zn-dependent protease with chaperone function